MSRIFLQKPVLIPLFILIIDRFFKSLAQKNSFAEAFQIIPNVLEFKFFANTGIAFSIPLSGPLLWFLSGIIIGFFTIIAKKGIKNRHAPTIFGYAIFIFGALSNLFDRIYYGYTTDYFIFFERSAVNFADGMIILGVIILLSNKNDADVAPLSTFQEKPTSQA